MLEGSAPAVCALHEPQPGSGLPPFFGPRSSRRTHLDPIRAEGGPTCLGRSSIFKAGMALAHERERCHRIFAKGHLILPGRGASPVPSLAYGAASHRHLTIIAINTHLTPHRTALRLTIGLWELAVRRRRAAFRRQDAAGAECSDMDGHELPAALGEKSLEWLEFWPESDFKAADLTMNSNPFGWAHQADHQQPATDSTALAPVPPAEAGLFYPGPSTALLSQLTEVSDL